MAKNDNVSKTMAPDPVETTNDGKLTTDELTELLRYFVGNPPYIQDRRFRDLVDAFQASDQRPVADDARTPQNQLPDYQNADASNS